MTPRTSRPLGAAFWALLVLALGALAPGKAGAQSLEQANRSVVRVIGTGDQVADANLGTGVVVDSRNGLIITNNHVVIGNDRSQLTRFVILPANSDVNTGALEARLISRDSARDLAVLQVDGLRLPAMRIAEGAPDQGVPVTAIGFPADSDRLRNKFDTTTTSTKGIVMREVAAANRGGVQAGVKTVEHNAELRRGMSGGPLVDTCGRLVGINNAVYVIDATQNKIQTAVAMPEVVAFVRESYVSADLRTTRRNCTGAGPFASADPRLGLALGALVLLAVFFSVLFALRNRGRPAGRGVQAQEPPPFRGSPGTMAPLPQNMDAPQHGLVLAGFDAKGRRVSIQFSPNELQRGVLIGRGSSAGRAAISDDRVSRRHARLFFSRGQFLLEDLGSKNKTYVNDEELTPNAPKPVRINDKLKFGPIELLLSKW